MASASASASATAPAGAARRGFAQAEIDELASRYAPPEALGSGLGSLVSYVLSPAKHASKAHTSLMLMLVYVAVMTVSLHTAPGFMLSMLQIDDMSTGQHLLLRMCGAAAASMIPMYTLGVSSKNSRFVGATVRGRLLFTAGIVLLVAQFDAPPVLVIFASVDFFGALHTVLVGGAAASDSENELLNAASDFDRQAAPRAQQAGRGFKGFGVSSTIYAFVAMVLGLALFMKPEITLTKLGLIDVLGSPDVIGSDGGEGGAFTFVRVYGLILACAAMYHGAAVPEANLRALKYSIVSRIGYCLVLLASVVVAAPPGTARTVLRLMAPEMVTTFLSMREYVAVHSHAIRVEHTKKDK